MYAYGRGDLRIRSCVAYTDWWPPTQGNRIAAGIVFAAALGTGVVALLWAHGPVRANAKSGRDMTIETPGGRADEEASSVASDQRPDRDPLQSERVGHVSRVSADRDLAPELPWPPLPSRVLPGQYVGTNGAESREPVHSSQPPPAPSKTLPGSSLGDVPDRSDAAVESDLPEQN